MSIVVDAEPYVEPRAVHDAVHAVHDAVHVVPPPDDAPTNTTIAVELEYAEMTFTQLFERAVPYVQIALLLLAAALTFRLGAYLYARYRRENVASVTAAPMDRRSLRRAAS